MGGASPQVRSCLRHISPIRSTIFASPGVTMRPAKRTRHTKRANRQRRPAVRAARRAACAGCFCRGYIGSLLRRHRYRRLKRRCDQHHQSFGRHIFVERGERRTIDSRHYATVQSKTLNIVGVGSDQTTIDGAMATRVMEILSTPNASMTVVLKNLGIEHGNATDGGHLGGPDALGAAYLLMAAR